MMIESIKYEVKKLHIGNKIRNLRKMAGFTLQDLSDRTSLSKPLLSQVENEIISPPIVTLFRISKALNVNISYFFNHEPGEEKIVLVKKDESKAVDSRFFAKEEDNYHYQPLAFKKSKKNMEPFLVEFKKKKIEKLPYFSHDGEEFIYLLDGVLELRTENQQYVLSSGDSLYFESSVPHAYRPLGRRNAKALIVHYNALMGMRWKND